MKRLLSLILFSALTAPVAAQDRVAVAASAPTDLSVTIYRDPERDVGDAMDIEWPEGFGMISETRTVTLPPGRSTIRFEGVAEGMVAVSAIVTGLPGGTIEKNRNADLLSPAALVNGALGNRVTITRTNPATGAATSERARVRTRADGGLVLETDEGFEAVRCSGLPEKLTFDRVPAGLSAEPVFSIDTYDPDGGTYEVTLTYLAWGFDWQADYVATFTQRATRDGFEMNLLSWLSLVNSNGQSFEDAQLLVIAGTLNVESDFEGLADPPDAQPLRLTCYPLGNTKAGSPVPSYQDYPPPPAPPPPSAPPGAGETIIVTGSRMSSAAMMEAAAPVSVMEAGEERLGDLKLYRVPERVTVSANGMKQVAFLNRQDVDARILYIQFCSPYGWIEENEFRNSERLLVTRNIDEKGLGVSLPQGEMTIFEPSAFGPQMVATTNLRDYARGQEIELELPVSSQVNIRCGRIGEEDDPDERRWVETRAEIRNANPHAVKMRLLLGDSADWDVRFRRARVITKNGQKIVELHVPANATTTYGWKIRSSLRD